MMNLEQSRSGVGHHTKSALDVLPENNIDGYFRGLRYVCMI